MQWTKNEMYYHQVSYFLFFSGLYFLPISWLSLESPTTHIHIIVLFISLLNKHWLSDFYVPGHAQDTWDSTVNKTNLSSLLTILLSAFYRRQVTGICVYAVSMSNSAVPLDNLSPSLSSTTHSDGFGYTKMNEIQPSYPRPTSRGLWL